MFCLGGSGLTDEVAKGADQHPALGAKFAADRRSQEAAEGEAGVADARAVSAEVAEQCRDKALCGLNSKIQGGASSHNRTVQKGNGGVRAALPVRPMAQSLATTVPLHAESTRTVDGGGWGLWPTFVAVKIRRNDTVMLITFMRFRSIPSVVSRAAAAVDRDCPAPSSAWETPGFEREREM